MKEDAGLSALLLDYLDHVPEEVKEAAYLRCPDAFELIDAAREGLDGLDGAAAERARLILNRPKLELILEQLNREGVRFAVRGGKDYPEGLNRVDRPPRLIYYKGDVSILKGVCVAVVGARACTSNGRDTAARFSGVLAGAGCAVVSGLARGIDAAAHRAALDAEGKTAAFLAHGFAHVYPAEHRGLLAEIAEKGVAVTEERFERRPNGFLFPKRNRLIAGVSRAVLVAEAGRKSGAWSTAERARDAGVPVFAAPGSVLSREAEGTNRFIRAHPESLALDPVDILRRLGIEYSKPEREAPEKPLQTPERALIVQTIREGKTRYEELAETTGMAAGTLNETLLLMELEGLITRLAGNEYRILGERNKL